MVLAGRPPLPSPTVYESKLGEFYTDGRAVRNSKERDTKMKRLQISSRIYRLQRQDIVGLSWYNVTSDMRKVASTMPTTEPETDATFKGIRQFSALCELQ